MPRQPEPELMDDAAEAEAYAQADFREVNEAFVRRLCELASENGAPEDAAAVDLGTGPGDIPLLVADVMPGWRTTAVDASEAMIKIARAKTDGIEFVIADAKHTGLPDHASGVVFSNSILHHINDTGELWSEVKRLARRGALVFFRDLARPESEDAARRIVDTYAGDESEVLREEYYRSLLSAYTPTEILEQLASAGLPHITVSMITDRHLDIAGII
jgi:ubiquinone/menaquinone biosynthesis C-methylase UbiE